MSELKDYDIMDIEAMDDERLEKSESGRIYVTRVYIKSEADKLIAELEENHKKEVEQLLIINREQAIAANRLRDSMEQVIRSKKYKQCLAMARWCFTKSNYHFVVGRSKGGKTGMTHFRISRLYSKWYKRWLKIAEQFKEAKCR